MMTFRETPDAVEGSSVASASMTSAGEREAQVIVDDDPEETPRPAAEETYAPGLTKGEDPVRLYLKEIGYESAFFWYVTACIFTSLTVYALMRDTRTHSAMHRHV